MSPPTKILGGLYLGSLYSAKDLKNLKDCGITHILCVASLLRKHFPKEFVYRRIPVHDRSDVNILHYFDECFNFIQNARKLGGVLVHCAAGVSRSGSVVIAYIMKLNKMSSIDAWNFVKAQRKCVCPNTGFGKQLLLYEAMGYSLRGRSKAHEIYRQVLKRSKQDVNMDEGGFVISISELLVIKRSDMKAYDDDDDEIRVGCSSFKDDAIKVSVVKKQKSKRD